MKLLYFKISPNKKFVFVWLNLSTNLKLNFTFSKRYDALTERKVIFCSLVSEEGALGGWLTHGLARGLSAWFRGQWIVFKVLKGNDHF